MMAISVSQVLRKKHLGYNIFKNDLIGYLKDTIIYHFPIYTLLLTITIPEL